MNCCILMGSPRKRGNTQALLEPLVAELIASGADCRTTWLYDHKIAPCTGCRACQASWSTFGCPIQDDVQAIFDQLLSCDLIVLATPIYSWYCTPPMKALLDRLVYGMNKYYGETRGPSLWAGKRVALLSTCGYRPEHGADLWESGVKRYCKHSGLQYMDMLAERDLGYRTTFMDEHKAEHARQFAQKLLAQIQ